MDKNLTKLSKRMSFILRHHPERIGLQLDSYGRIDLSTFIAKFNQHYQTPLNRQVIEKIITSSDKQRYAIELSDQGETIRALYGHSIPVKPLSLPQTPPKILFHGTSRVAAKSILIEGIKKMDRDFVHLSSNIQIAEQVGVRHDPQPVVLKIMAQQAAEQGVLFYPTKSGIWLVKYIAPQFIHH
ncbi:RNA 2'-phosphotransferase [Agrilactobacillus fermenti]|uniref:RNA 2'-phosphotransferase n=1 Tax=Agrilactobacillus fermenti TaxID=2586909 RepID=UPI001E5C7CAB|nr:RNA 2'-phosphotransferase [Agrilactobacillus fermenti]MCD2256915.1 RNA 2'-phosphotransferase [Agrilactobacillus fermenti]